MVGETVFISGTAVIFDDETLDVTCAVRVAETVNTDSVNVAVAAKLSQDILDPKLQSDNLNSINDGNRNPGEGTNDRWTNWNNRYKNENVSITLTWDTAQLLSDVNLFYRYDGSCAHPKSIVFSYSLNGSDFVEVGHTETAMPDISVGNGAAFSYALDQVINPVALKITFTQPGGTSEGKCVGLYEVEAMTYAASLEKQSSAALSGIFVDGTAIEGFDPAVNAYEIAAGDVTAEAAENVGITILPMYNGHVRILTVSEDGASTNVYTLTVPDEVCTHSVTELQNAEDATCTKPGYSGDVVCTECGMKIAFGSTIAALGHKWNSGIITKEPTAEEDGIKTFTCITCSETRDETVKYQSTLKEPTVSSSLSKTAGGKITVIGQVDDYANLDDYYEITAHGLLYIQSAMIGSRTLTINTTGRTKVTFSEYSDDGSFFYSFTPDTKSTAYTYRAFVTYMNTVTGESVTVYSNMMRSNYNDITN